MAVDQVIIDAENALRLGATMMARRLLAGRTDTEALVLPGIASLREGETGTAITAFAGAVAADPDHAIAHAYHALALAHTGRVPEAQEALERALTLAPDNFTVRLLGAQYFSRLGFYPTAVARLERALSNGAPDRDADAAAHALLHRSREKAKGNFVRVNQTDFFGAAVRALWARLRRPTRPAVPPAPKSAPAEA